MQIQLACGRDGLRVEFPDDALVVVIEPRFVRGLPDERAALVAAMRSPEGAQPLRDLVQPDDMASAAEHGGGPQGSVPGAKLGGHRRSPGPDS